MIFSDFLLYFPNASPVCAVKFDHEVENIDQKNISENSEFISSMWIPL